MIRDGRLIRWSIDGRIDGSPVQLTAHTPDAAADLMRAIIATALDAGPIYNLQIQISTLSVPADRS